jgi:hypothetical protein
MRWLNVCFLGAISLSMGLDGNETMKHLLLKHNNIGDKGALSFLISIAESTTICTLSLRRNQITPKFVKNIEQICSSMY